MIYIRDTHDATGKLTIVKKDYGCHFLRNDAQYGNWRIYGNAVNNWSGLRFTSAEISVMAGDGSTKRCGFHYNGTGWGMYLDKLEISLCVVGIISVILSKQKSIEIVSDWYVLFVNNLGIWGSSII
jgi:hypothetical protein